jgi:phosphatidylglycerophosphate synthase
MTALMDAPSRAATDALLAELRAGHWSPAAWARFLTLAARRSVHQARAHPRAVAELTALHVAMALWSGPRGYRWIAVSWALAASHLGLLDTRRSLGVANALTLLRANLPALGGQVRWLPALAMASDLIDGHLARCTGAETLFGRHADSLADAVFWTWFTVRHEPSRGLRVVALSVWVAPVALVTMASVARGRMVDAPRPTVLRPAAAMQAVIAARALFPVARWLLARVSAG